MRDAQAKRGVGSGCVGSRVGPIWAGSPVDHRAGEWLGVCMEYGNRGLWTRRRKNEGCWEAYGPSDKSETSEVDCVLLEFRLRQIDPLLENIRRSARSKPAVSIYFCCS